MIRATRQAVARLRAVLGDTAGSMAIETAIVAPILVLLSIGGFEVSRMVSRQHELQAGVAEAEAIALAANMGAETKTTEVEKLLKKSLDLKEDQVSVTKKYRCLASEQLVDKETDCFEDDWTSSYMVLSIKDSYAPIWTKLGISGPFDYKVERRVQLS